jgi:hypothetical protein
LYALCFWFFGFGFFCFCFVFVLFFGLFATESHYAAQAGLKFVILLPLPTDCWDDRYAPSMPQLLEENLGVNLGNLGLAKELGLTPKNEQGEENKLDFVKT